MATWRRWQYQAKAECPGSANEPGPRYESPWHQGYTDPQVNFGSRVKAAVGIALIASGLIANPVVINPPQGISVQWDGPVFSRTIIQQDVAFTCPAPIPGWYSPFSEPVRVKPAVRTGDNPDLFFNPVVINPPKGISVQWDGPVFSRIIIPQDVVGSLQPIVNTADQWAQPWSEPPSKAKPRASEYPALAFTAPSGEVITVDKWFVSYQDPVRVKQGLRTGDNPDAIGSLQPIVSTADRWAPPWSEPVRVKPTVRTGDNQDLFFDPQPFVPLPDGWGPQYPDFVKAKAGIRTGDNQDLFFVPVTSAPGNATAMVGGLESTVFGDRTFQYQGLAQVPFNEDFGIQSKWYQPWSDPVRRKFFQGSPQEGISLGIVVSTSAATAMVSGVESAVFKRNVVLYQGTAWTPQPTETITVDKWFTSYQDPVRVKPAVRTGDNQDLFFDPQPFVSFGWYEPLTDPVRVKQGLRTGDNPDAVGSLQPIVSTADRWEQPWSMPPKAKPRAAEYLAFTAAPFTAEVITVDKWFVPYQDPPARKVLRTGDNQDFFFNPLPIPTTVGAIGSQWDGPTFSRTVIPQDVAQGAILPIVSTADRWEQPWSTPLRAKPRAAEYPALAFVGPATEIITVDKWFVPYQDPPSRKVLRTGDNPDFFFDPRPFPSTQGAVVSQWDGPTFSRVIIPQDVAQGAILPIVSTADRWEQPWSLPPKAKPRAAEYPSLAFQFTPSVAVSAPGFVASQWDGPTFSKTIIPMDVAAFSPRPIPSTQGAVASDWGGPIFSRTIIQQDIAFQFTPPVAVSAPGFVTSQWDGPVFFRTIIPQEVLVAGFVPIIPSVTNWYEWFAEPVRFRVFGTHLQKVDAWTPQVIVPVVRFARGYIIV